MPKAKVMIIDDAIATRNSLTRVLRKEGYDAVAVADGLQALGSVGATPPDAIVLDLSMPHMHGLEVLQKLRQNPLWRSVPVLVFSGMADAVAKRATELGATEILQKGNVSVPQLLERIKALLGSAVPAF